MSEVILDYLLSKMFFLFVFFWAGWGSLWGWALIFWEPECSFCNEKVKDSRCSRGVVFNPPGPHALLALLVTVESFLSCYRSSVSDSIGQSRLASKPRGLLRHWIWSKKVDLRILLREIWCLCQFPTHNLTKDNHQGASKFLNTLVSMVF